MRALSCFCEIQSGLTRDKIISLYGHLKSTSDCLVDYDIEGHSVSSTTAPRSYPTSGTIASSSTFQYISKSSLHPIHKGCDADTACRLDPSLLSLGKDARGCGTRTSFPTPDSHRSPAPILPSTREPLNRTPSSGLDREASDAFRGQDPSHAATTAGRDFDSALQDLEDMELGHSRHCDRTNSPDSSTQSSLGKDESSASETVDVSEDGASIRQLQTPAPTFDSAEGMGQDPSHRLAPNTPVDTANVEEDAHRESPNAPHYDDSPQTPEASAESSGWSPGASYSTPETSAVATPTTMTTQNRRAEAAEGNQNSQSCPSGRWSLKHQPTVEDASDESESNAEDLSDDPDDFGDREVKAVLDDAQRFLRDTSVDHESCSSSVTNAVGTDPDTNGPALASCRPESDKQHALPTNGNVDRPQTCSEGASRNIRRKRRLSSTVESREALPTRNRRPRLHNSVSQTAPAHPNLDEDRWEGRFSRHSLLSDLLPDQKDEIERKSNQVLRSDLAEFIDKYTKIWKSTGFWSSPSLDPSNYHTSAGGKGHAIWRYVEAMQAEGETHYLKSRFADIMLYLEYVEEFNRQKKAGHPGQTAKTRATNVICGTGSLPKATAKKTRMSFHEHKLVGERWWWSGCFLGRGFILLCSQETGNKMFGFPNLLRLLLLTILQPKQTL